MGNVVEVRDLKLHYLTSKGAVRAVDGIDFSLATGETLGVVGESGCGKTTIGLGMLRMPTPPGRIVGGSIVIDGTDIVPLSENQLRRTVRWQTISMVFQGAMNCLTPVFTVGKQMMETLQQHKEMDRAEAEEIICRYFSLVGLPPDIVRRYPHELSGGMKQRVVIAMALFLEPKVVILDEPTTALDVIVQAQILNVVKDLKRRLGVSMIFITHDLATEAEVADRIMVMYAGKVAEIAPNRLVYDRAPCHPYTQRLLAATPRLHAKVDELAFIPGAPPDLLDPPKGCRFQPRCSVAMDACAQEPPLIEIEPGHLVACWRCRNA
ncbi:MAG: dipeptide/oligopeptide/nickel ABC transporter ATP-binding protein [Spirochaetes bacterium RBG_13_68_11]|nr:MAG: dipeptide/oligopeptide/nickel ABC transporter ATP-binding protein [Spirochaetes bacterium RBG_13_68_11]